MEIFLDADAEGSNLYEAKLRHAAYTALRRFTLFFCHRGHRAAVLDFKDFFKIFWESIEFDS